MKKIYLEKIESQFYLSCLCASLATALFSILISLSYRILTNDTTPGQDILVSTPSGVWRSLMALVVFTPLIETALTQTLVISILRKLKLNDTAIIATATMIFSLIHLKNGPISAVTNVFTGIVLNLAYIFWLNRTASTSKAFEASMLIHAAHNAYAVLIAFIASNFS